jgi:hypothetical protein
MFGVTLASPFAADVKAILDRVGTRKRKCYVDELPAGREMRLRSYWDGGSRDVYTAFDAQGKRLDVSVSGAPAFTAEPQPWTPQPGDVLVVTGVCCGKESTPRITRFV